MCGGCIVAIECYLRLLMRKGRPPRAQINCSPSGDHADELISVSLGNAHPPEQISKSRVATQRVPDRLAFIESPDRSLR